MAHITLHTKIDVNYLINSMKRGEKIKVFRFYPNAEETLSEKPWIDSNVLTPVENESHPLTEKDYVKAVSVINDMIALSKKDKNVVVWAIMSGNKLSGCSCRAPAKKPATRKTITRKPATRKPARK